MIKDYFSSIWETAKNFSDYSSCANRKEFWGFFLFGLCVIVVSYILLFTFGSVAEVSSGLHRTYVSTSHPWDWLVSAFVILFLIPLVAVAVRRLHDSGRSGFWMFVFFVPFVGFWILLFLLCLPTNPNSEYSDTFFDSLDEK